MKLFRCPGCANEQVKGVACFVVLCECGMLMKKVDEGKHIQPMADESPEIIFRGKGWPGKDIKNERL